MTLDFMSSNFFEKAALLKLDIFSCVFGFSKICEMSLKKTVKCHWSGLDPTIHVPLDITRCIFDPRTQKTIESQTSISCTKEDFDRLGLHSWVEGGQERGTQVLDFALFLSVPINTYQSHFGG